VASVFRRTYKRAIPDGAETVIRQGKPHARWRDAHNRVRVAPLSEDGESIVLTARTFSIEFTDASGKRRTIQGFVDRDASEKKARDLEKQAAQIRAGLVSHDRNKSGLPIRQALEAWLADLQRQDRAAKYVHNVGAMMTRMIENCGWHTLDGIRSDSLTAFLATPAMRKLAGRTRNEFLTTATTFCNWCTRQRPLPWLASNPFLHVARADESEKRRAKRALTPEELVRLKDVSGPRWPVYLAACLTGLRRSELRALLWSDVHLDADKPYVQLRAKTTKARRGDLIALPIQLVEVLGAMQRAAADPVFPTMPDYRMVRRDLARAAIPHRDEQGRIVGLHAMRKTYCTMLNSTGTPVREAMSAMRVTSVHLLHDVYHDSTLTNLSAAADRLPRIGEEEAKKKADKSGR
jgi:integrase